MSVLGALDRPRLRLLRRQLLRPAILFRFLLLRIAFLLKLHRVPALPVTLDVEPNNTCNFECPHCQVTHWAKQRVHLDRTAFERILDQFPGLARVKLQGMGEPLLNREMLPMLRAGEVRGVSMSFTSNGSVLTPALAREMLALERTRITFSIDGATADVFEQVRVGGRFAKVRENVRTLVAARGDAREPAIDVWTVVTAQNVSQLAAIVRLAAELGTDGITLQLFVGNWGKKEMEMHARSARVAEDDPVLAGALRDARAAADAVGLPLTVFRDNLLSRRRKCSWPWKSAYVASNGDVIPCCVVADSDTVRMGNLFERPFREIWNGDAYRRLRDRIRSHDLPDFCRGCYADADGHTSSDGAAT